MNKFWVFRLREKLLVLLLSEYFFNWILSRTQIEDRFLYIRLDL